MHDQQPPDGPTGSTDQRTDCSAALEELYVFLDGEVTVARRALIRSHLEDCTDCLEAFDFEAELRMVVAVRCRNEVVPESLRQRVAEALHHHDGPA